MTVRNKVDVFFREVERSFHISPQFRDVITHLRQFFGKHALKRPRCRPGRGGRTGINQIRYGFGLSQIHTTVQKGPLRKFPGIGQTKIQRTPQLQYPIQNHLQDGHSAVCLDFQHIFPGVGMRPFEIKNHRPVNVAAVTFLHRQQRRMSGFEFLSGKQTAHKRLNVLLLSGDTHNTDTAAAGSRRTGHNGILI